MEKLKYIILGAGPSGLTFANKLYKSGEKSFIVLEKEQEVGGLCRSQNVDEAPFDIGGGHFLDVRLQNVNKFLFEFMPIDEWNLFERDSKILLNHSMINHPIEANIWQMDLNSQVEYLKSIASAGCNIGSVIPSDFVDWIDWKLGKKISEDYMLPYNKKLFGNELNQLGIYWLDKLPDVSFDETLMSCLTKKAYGSQPGHAQFYYPKKYGYGELWLRMGENIKEHIIYNTGITEIDFECKTVTDRAGNMYQADYIITTIPWHEFKRISGLPNGIKQQISRLKYISVQTEYFNETMDTKAHWIYYPDMSVPYHRILVRSNFCSSSRGYWTETNADRIKSDERENFKYFNEYAYPLNTIDKPLIMEKLLAFAESKGVYGLGRWGEHQHYNSDVTVDKAMRLFYKLHGDHY